MDKFKNIQEFEEHIRGESKIPDTIILTDPDVETEEHEEEVKMIEFKMTSYDMSGKEVIYDTTSEHSEKLRVVIHNSDRYETLEDSKVDIYWTN